MRDTCILRVPRRRPQFRSLPIRHILNPGIGILSCWFRSLWLWLLLLVVVGADSARSTCFQRPSRRPPHMRLPSKLESHKQITSPFSILKFASQFIQRTKTEIQVPDRDLVVVVTTTNATNPRVAAIAATRPRRSFGYGRIGHGDGDENERRGESDGDDLVVHAVECVVLFVLLEEFCDGCGGFDAHSSRMQVAGSLSGVAGLDVVLGDPGFVEGDDDLVILHTALVSTVSLSRALVSIVGQGTYCSIRRCGSFGVVSSSKSIFRFEGRFSFHENKLSVTLCVNRCRSCREILVQPYLARRCVSCQKGNQGDAMPLTKYD